LLIAPAASLRLLAALVQSAALLPPSQLKIACGHAGAVARLAEQVESESASLSLRAVDAQAGLDDVAPRVRSVAIGVFGAEKDAAGRGEKRRITFQGQTIHP
jgi:hypothetical protein